MSLLGKYTLNKNSNLNREKHEYKMPAVTREDKTSISLKKAITISTVLHPVMLVVIWILALIMTAFGMFPKPVPKVNDIEFVLVDKEDTPIHRETAKRAHINSRSGGINDPKKPVSMPSAKPSAKPQPSSPSPAPAAKKPSIVNKIQQSVAPKKAQQTPSKVTTTNKNLVPSPVVEQPVPKPQAARPQPPTAKPSVKPPMTPKVVSKPTGTPFSVPVPSGGTKAGQYSTGPVGGSGTSPTGGAKGSGTYSPNPSLAPVGSGSGTKIASSNGSGTGGSGTGSGYGRGTGSGGGNPGGGGGRPGIDTVREPDFGPYMRDLTRRIKMNWNPPKGNESKRVVLIFKIAKDGRLLSCSVLKSSGLQSADNAAINAVKLSAPFRPLPPDYKGSNIDIQFTFDYNVFGASKY